MHLEPAEAPESADHASSRAKACLPGCLPNKTQGSDPGYFMKNDVTVTVGWWPGEASSRKAGTCRLLFSPSSHPSCCFSPSGSVQ